MNLKDRCIILMKAIILAAGQGKRMKSDLPKVLHNVSGKPMVNHVIDACKGAGVNDIVIVVGQGGEEVQESVTAYYKDCKDIKLTFVWQKEQLGTGHAVMCAKESISKEERIVILCGDTPLITPELIKDVLKYQQDKSAHGVVVSTVVPDPKGYGRVITSPSGEFKAIVEERDLEKNQKHIVSINTGMYVFMGLSLIHGLQFIVNDNDQNEYYLTDVPKVMVEDDFKVAVYEDAEYSQFLGINSQKQLAEAASIMRERIADKHFNNGVIIIDPASVYIDEGVQIEEGVVIHPGTVLTGTCKIGAGTVLNPYTVADGATIGKNCQIGPFAYLRNGTIIGDNCRIGNFVEVKNSKIGDGTKAAHHAYIGDAMVGNNVNYSCGAITVNYDGKNKHLTEIEDGAFVGSNVNLVAPVKINSDAFVAAGSTITDEVPKGALAIARKRQEVKENWKNSKQTGATT